MIIFNSNKKRITIFMVILLSSSSFSLIIAVMLLLNDSDPDFTNYILLFLPILIVFPLVLIYRRHYIKSIIDNKENITIVYYDLFAMKTIIGNKKDFSFSYSPINRDYKFINVYYKNKRIIKQFPFLEWRNVTLTNSPCDISGLVLNK